jgi:hypothetical protein
MHNKAWIFWQVAALALVDPISVSAQSADLSISYHLNRTAMFRADYLTVPRARIGTEIELAQPVNAKVNLPEAPYYARLFSGTSTPNEKFFISNWSDGAIMFSATRTRSLRKFYGSKVPSINRFSAAEAQIGVIEHVGPNDSVELSTSYVLERRRQSLFVGRHNVFGTQDVALTTSWTHDGEFRMSISGFDTRPTKVRGNLARIVELGGGAPLAVRGFALSASLSPTQSLQTFAIGLDVRRLQHSTRDAEVIGALANRNETRWAVTLHRAF